MLAIIAGIFLGHYFPAIAVKMEIIGKTFVDIIKVFIVPIIFFTIVLGISGMGDLKKVGRIGIKSLIYFEIITTIALVIGITVALWLQPGNIDKSNLQIMDATKYTQNASTDFDWTKFFLSNITLQVLIISIIIGIALNFSKQRLKAVELLSKGSKLVFTGLKYVMYLAPLGAFGGMAFTVGKFGLHTLVPLAKLMGTVYLTMFVFIFFVLGGILWYFKENIFNFLRYIKEKSLIIPYVSEIEKCFKQPYHLLCKSLKKWVAVNRWWVWLCQPATHLI